MFDNVLDERLDTGYRDIAGNIIYVGSTLSDPSHERAFDVYPGVVYEITPANSLSTTKLKRTRTAVVPATLQKMLPKNPLLLMRSNMITDALNEVLQDCKIADYFINGQCSKCGECCSRYLPVTHKEIKIIKSYIKGKNLKIAPESYHSCFGNVKNFYCPFLNQNATNKCQIYPVRPAICKVYSCHNLVAGNFEPIMKLKGKMNFVDLYEIFGR